MTSCRTVSTHGQIEAPPGDKPQFSSLPEPRASDTFLRVKLLIHSLTVKSLHRNNLLPSISQSHQPIYFSEGCLLLNSASSISPTKHPSVLLLRHSYNQGWHQQEQPRRHLLLESEMTSIQHGATLRRTLITSCGDCRRGWT